MPGDSWFRRSVATVSYRLRPPSLVSDRIDRPRLSHKILSTAASDVLVITAAHGYGATTAVTAAVRQSTDAVYWITLDEQVADADARVLLAAAVGAENGGPDELLERLDGSDPAWLVIDGVSQRHHPGLVSDLLTIESHLPPHIRLALISSHDFSAIPRATHLDESDLAFTADEALELLARRNPGIDIDTANEIIEVAQGWANALVAVSASQISIAPAQWLRGAGAVQLFSGWFAALSTEHQQFLRQTRVLSVLCGSNCAAVAQEDRAGELLIELEAAHAYLRPHAPAVELPGRSWRRHGLLSAYLDQMDWPDRRAGHSRAADWYMKTSDVDAVMHHLMEAGRMKEAGSFLAEHESGLLSRGGKAGTVLSWYDQIAASAEDRFTHLLRIAWGQAMSRDVVGADATLNQLTSELAHIADDEDWNLGDGVGADAQQPGSKRSAAVAQCALLRAYVAQFHADPATVIQGARRMCVEPPDYLNSDSVQVAPILLARGLLWSGQPEAAARVVETAMRKPASNEVLRESHAAGIAAMIDVANGYVRRGKSRADAATRWLDRNGFGRDSLHYGPITTVQALVALESGEVDHALRVAEQALHEARVSQILAEVAMAHVVLARCHLATGDYGAALRALSEASAAATQDIPDSALLVVVDQTRALVHLAAGDMVRAVRIIRALPPSEARSLLWARAGVTRQPAVARRTAETVQASSPRLEAERQAVLAAIHARTSRRIAQGHLRKAAAIAYKHGMGQLLNPADPALITLAQSTALEYQDDHLLWLLKVRALPRSDSPTRVAETPLSRGELQLLAVLPSRAKNADIAASLGVSINTVKTRLRRLYAKLGVNNRDEAIERARQRGLMQS